MGRIGRWLVCIIFSIFLLGLIILDLFAFYFYSILSKNNPQVAFAIFLFIIGIALLFVVKKQIVDPAVDLEFYDSDKEKFNTKSFGKIDNVLIDQ